MLLTLLVINSIVAIVLYYFALNGINHFIDHSPAPEDEAKKDESKLKLTATLLLLILLSGNGIIYYNSYNQDNGGTVDVVEED